MTSPTYRPLFAAVLSITALSLSACASSPAAQDSASAAPNASGVCQADKVQWAVGQEGNQANMGRVWRESGAGLIRPIGPNQAVTRDYREDRVNVELDDKNLITKVSCG
ncbi:I78 family peptidase inhibitor [Pseudoxanthomonas sp. UTMC 1351]|uniref:I78 family peptidase inhibitor n=1 Tax=Pseudoxanthomonas sp. UTMC 1351 TaxID=2695853 RepID=UPI0034CDE2B1